MWYEGSLAKPFLYRETSGLFLFLCLSSCKSSWLFSFSFCERFVSFSELYLNSSHALALPVKHTPVCAVAPCGIHFQFFFRWILLSWWEPLRHWQLPLTSTAIASLQSIESTATESTPGPLISNLPPPSPSSLWNYTVHSAFRAHELHTLVPPTSHVPICKSGGLNPCPLQTATLSWQIVNIAERPISVISLF